MPLVRPYTIPPSTLSGCTVDFISRSGRQNVSFSQRTSYDSKLVAGAVCFNTAQTSLPQPCNSFRYIFFKSFHFRTFSQKGILIKIRYGANTIQIVPPLLIMVIIFIINSITFFNRYLYWVHGYYYIKKPKFRTI